jgi:hypothetical protein
MFLSQSASSWNGSDRLLKNAHMSRASWDYPAASPSWRRARSRSLFVATPSGPLTNSRACQKSLLIRRDGTPHPPFGEVLHLPACRSLGAGRGIFEQPEEKHFFGKLVNLPFSQC